MAPEFGKPIHHLPLIPADVLKKTSRPCLSIRGSGNLLPEAPTRRLRPFRLKRRGYVSMDAADGCVSVCRHENAASHRSHKAVRLATIGRAAAWCCLSGLVPSGNAGFS